MRGCEQSMLRATEVKSNKARGCEKVV